jgi:outer membrane protein TolC
MPSRELPPRARFAIGEASGRRETADLRVRGWGSSAGGAAIALFVMASPSPAFAEEPAVATATGAGSALGLEELVRDALKANLQIKAEETIIDQAKALYSRAKAQAYPRFSLRTLFGGPTPEAKTTVLNDPSTATPESLEGDFDFGNLGITFRVNAEGVFPIYTFGKIDSAKEAAGHAIHAARHKVEITSADVIMNVHKAFWAYQLAQSFANSLQEGDEIIEGVLEKVETLLEDDSPQVTENDRLRLLHAAATVRVRLKEARQGTELALRALKLLSGREQHQALTVRLEEVAEVPEEPPSLEELKPEAHRRRPELEALRALIEAQGSWLDFKNRALLPDLFLGGVLELAYTSNASDQTNPFVYDRFNFFDVGVGIGLNAELDVFNKLAEAEEAEAQRNTTVAQYLAVRQAVDLELGATHAELVGRYRRITDLKRAHRASRGWLAASVLAYDIGIGDAGELIDAFLARATAEGELFKTYFDIQIGHAKLGKALGRLGQMSE